MGIQIQIKQNQMNTFLKTVLFAQASLAVNIAAEGTHNPFKVEHVSSAEECPAGTIFEQSACACFVPYQCYIYCPGLDPNRPINSPLEACNCISVDDYESIFEHGMGSDCQAWPLSPP